MLTLTNIELLDKQHVCIESYELTSGETDSSLQPSQFWEICSHSNIGLGWHRDKMMKTRMTYTKPSLGQFWDPYQNGRCWPAHRELFSPFPLSYLFCFPLRPYKNPCLHRDVEVGFVTRVPHFLVMDTWMNHFPPASCFMSSVFVAASSWTWVQLQV